MEANSANVGLEGVVVADTSLSDVDGEVGRLVIAGHDVERWALTATFEEACAALFAAAGLGDTSADHVRARLGAYRVRASQALQGTLHLVRRTDGMDALRGGLGAMDLSGVPAGEAHLAVVAATGVIAAAFSRLHEDGANEALAADPTLSHAADTLRMSRGRMPTAAETRGLDTYLVTVADHGLNASTFAARVCASTGSDVVSAITAAVGTLKGPLHGGAPGPVLDMLDAIASPDDAERFVDAELAAGRRIMGMGHRIYRVRDPRALVFERALAALDAAGTPCPRLPLARAVERVAEGALARRYPNRSLRTNVEFYTAVLLDAIGLDRSAFSPTFAVGRVAGWCAHVAEQRARGRLIRPASRYVGAPAQA